MDALYTVTATRLNLRARPDTESPILSVLANGTAVIPEDDLEDAWWRVRLERGGQQGYVARRYLAPVSTASPPVPSDAERLLWTMTERCIGRVAYKLGAKHSAQGQIDCSGWVCELTQAAFTAINAAAAPEMVFERGDLGALVTHSDGIVSGIERRTGFVLHGAAITAAALRPGMLIGLDNGSYDWERNNPPRVYGIDHIVQVMRDPATGRLWISQSSSSGKGVNRVALDDWLGAAAQVKLRANGKLHVVDPFLMADRNTRFAGLSEAVKVLEAPAPTPAPTPAAVVAPVASSGIPELSQAAIDLIIRFEISSRAYYESKLIHPTWPGHKSGITIGIGHDLGFTNAADFDRNWAGLAAGDRAKLRATIGKTGAGAQALLPGVKAIVVPWALAEAVYRTIDMRKWATRTAQVLPNCDLLSGDCFGALVSLSFNRGASYATPPKPGVPIDNYTEMRAIRALMTARQFALIPAQIRAMKRIWRGTKVERGLSARRDAEADLFDQGLRAMAAAAEAARAPAAAGEAAVLVGETVSTPATDEGFVDRTEDDLIAEAKAPPTAAVLDQADIAARSQVTWASDDKAIDYAHLGTLPPQNVPFTLRAEDLERLYALNAFPEDHGGASGKILFGLRGCGIVSAGDGFAGEVVLVDRRPDHRAARCVMGVWERASGQIAVFPASTVPNAIAVTSWQRKRDSGNLLPTGFYRYILGAHNGRPGCLILRKTVGQPRVVAVRRSSNDLRYERTDDVQLCAPGDNIHPTFFRTAEAGFSSFGCQTVVGSADARGNHSGAWASFRKAAGLGTRAVKDGDPFGYMLLTGAEASLASALRRVGATAGATEWEDLRRLRFGSRGEPVRRLQAALGLPAPDGDFGPNTSGGFHQHQRAQFEGRCDGICSPQLAEAAGWSIF